MTTSLLETTSDTLGVLDTTSVRLCAGATAVEGTNGGDSATVQGSISLSSSKLFSVTQSSTEVTPNDNYFTTGSASLSTVSNVDLRTQSKARTPYLFWTEQSRRSPP